MHSDLAAIKPGDEIEGFYAVKESSLQQTSQGKLFIRFTLGDATGSVLGNLWEADEKIHAASPAGSVVKIRAAVETYRGATQLRLLRLRPADYAEADPADLLPVSKADLQGLQKELTELRGQIVDPDYQALLEAFFADKDFAEKFYHCPAAKNNHHAWVGGLLEHTVCLGRFAKEFLAGSPAKLNGDLLLAGVILHDAGKVEELSWGATIEYTDRGSLLGHLTIGAQMIEERAGALPDFPATKKWLLQHLILSHHGKFEYGSPVLPAVPEALALHHLDNLDAKTVAACDLIAADINNPQNWTPRSWMLETRLFKAAADLPPAAGKLF